MEGQQSGSGDLSDAPPDEPTAESDVESPDAFNDTAFNDTGFNDTGFNDTGFNDTAAVSEPPPEPSAASKWLARNGRTAALASAVGFFVAAGAFAAATAQPYLSDRAAVATKMTIATTAAKAITTLWTYTPDDMDKLPERSSQYLTGDFEQQYRKYVDAIAPTNKQAKVTSKTTVVGAAVESLQGPDATALIYTNTTSESPQNNNIPSLQYLSYRLDLKREGRDWRVTKMSTVTSLNLTPKL